MPLEIGFQNFARRNEEKKRRPKRNERDGDKDDHTHTQSGKKREKGMATTYMMRLPWLLVLTNCRILKAEYLPNEFLAQMHVFNTSENRRRRTRREQMPYRNTKAPNPNSRSLIPRTLGQHILKWLVGTRDLRAQWSRFVFCFFLWNFGGNKTKQKRQSRHIYRIRSWRSPKKTKQDFMKFLFSCLAFSQFSPSYDFFFFSFLFLSSKDFFFLFLFLLLSSNRFKPKILNK